MQQTQQVRNVHCLAKLCSFSRVAVAGKRVQAQRQYALPSSKIRSKRTGLILFERVRLPSVFSQCLALLKLNLLTLDLRALGTRCSVESVCCALRGAQSVSETNNHISSMRRDQVRVIVRL